MRNDVKLGFAIGGVLLAVVIVFALVNSGSSSPEGVAEAPEDPNAALTDATTPAAPEAPPIARSVTPTLPATITPDALPAPETARAAESHAAEPRVTDPWEQALNTGRLPMMMANTGSTNPSPAAAKPEIVAPKTARVSHPEEKAAPPAANRPEAIEGAAPTNTTTITPPSHVRLAPRPEPDADGATRGTATTLSQPTSSVLKQVSARTHKIKSGETFSTIASAYYGHVRYARLIARANPGVDATRLQIGQEINLPAFDPTTETRRTRTAAASATVDSRTHYRVQSGDSLHRICMKLYGDPKKVDALYELNKKEIGPNPTRLQLNTVLQLPAPPSVVQR